MWTVYIVLFSLLLLAVLEFKLRCFTLKPASSLESDSAFKVLYRGKKKIIMLVIDAKLFCFLTKLLLLTHKERIKFRKLDDLFFLPFNYFLMKDKRGLGKMFPHPSPLVHFLFCFLGPLGSQWTKKQMNKHISISLIQDKDLINI